MTATRYPTPPANPDFPSIEKDILAFWREQEVFEASVESRPAEKGGESNTYVFYDGPPFANGMPHYGHLLTGFVKDVFPRYQTMKGQRVERRFGWDCHGLPAEMGAEKELGIAGRGAILNYGMAKFNSYCQSSVMRYTHEWERYVTRQARWVDFEDDYKTMDRDFMESVLWAFKQLYEKELVYEAYRVMPYSWAAETPLSNFETRLDNAYRDRTDKAVTVAFELNDAPKGAPEADKYYVLAWTTTPWTLPSNLALAAHPEMKYAAILTTGEDTETPSPLAGEGRGEGAARLIAFARELRKNATDAEKILWSLLRGKQLENLKFLRQEPIGRYIVDFVNYERRLIIELDGGQHALPEHVERDEMRSAWLWGEGFEIVRYWNNDVLENPEGVAADLWDRLGEPPHPTLPHQGGGLSVPLQTMESSPSPLAGEGCPAQGRGEGASAQKEKPIICYLLASSALQAYRKDLPETEPVLLNGGHLIGLTYKPLFPYFAHHPDAFRILDGSSFIEEGSGTGIVHMAPGFGEEDQKLCEAAGINVVVPVDGAGRYTSDIYDLPRPPLHSPLEGESNPAQTDLVGGSVPAGRRDSGAPTPHDSPSASGLVSSAPPRGGSNMLETDRLTLRPFTPDEYPLYRSLQSDPKVAATTSDGLLPEEKIRAEFDRFLTDQAAKGFTQWAIFRKEDNAFLGRAGFDNREYDRYNTTGKPAVELRYAFLSEFWGQGYATEIGTALLDWAAQHLPHEAIIAGCNPEYAPAKKVLTKLGFAAGEIITYHNGVRILTQTKLVTPATPVPPLKLQGLNVIADTRKDEGEPYSKDQLEKYGLANLRIVNWLKATGHLIKQEDYTHSYPHCWRTDTPLIYRAMPSWYVEVTKFKDRMVELNQGINWIPGHIKDGLFGKWLEGARDWSISRNRFWGCPIPVWRSDNPHNKQPYVFGSIKELEAFFGPHMQKTSSPSQGEDRGGGGNSPRVLESVERPDPHPASPWKGEGQGEFRILDLHRPFIDTLTAPDPTDPAYTLRRVEDVFDCWFESGSMPFAQDHFMGETPRPANYPADFIVEYQAQTRGWFYTMMVLGTALFDAPPFLNCICHGVVIDEDGEKLSKRKGNYPDPLSVFDQFGADALRWFMMSSPIMRGSELQIDRDGAFIRDAVRLYIKPLWNAYNFFCLYANADTVQAEFRTDSDNVMDRYILAKLQAAIADVGTAFDAYDTPAACQAITAFLEVLNNWYIRRNRARFWKGEVDADKMSAYHTLYTVLHTLCRTAAPLLPLVTEAIFAGLTQSGVMVKEGSVHLQSYPDPADFLPATGEDAGTIYHVMKQMDLVRDICNAGLAIRNAENIRVRQPLNSVTIYSEANSNESETAIKVLGDIIADELNVHHVHHSGNLSEVANRQLKVNFQAVGKRIPEKMKTIIAAQKKGEWRFTNGDFYHHLNPVEIAGETLNFEDYSIDLTAKNPKGAQATSDKNLLVVLDLTLTPELEAEGIARDVVRLIQQSRKEADFSVSDRIRLTIDAETSVAAAIEANKTYIAEQTLAQSLDFGDAGHEASGTAHTARGEIDGKPIALKLEKVAA